MIIAIHQLKRFMSQLQMIKYSTLWTAKWCKLLHHLQVELSNSYPLTLNYKNMKYRPFLYPGLKAYSGRPINGTIYSSFCRIDAYFLQ